MIKANKDEHVAFVREYEDLGHRIKEQNSMLEESILMERKKGPMYNDMEYHRGDLTMEEEKEMVGRVGELSAFLLTEAESLASIEDRIGNYREIFEKLKRLAGVDTVEEVIEVYHKHEEDMFSLYNYIQSQNGEIDSIRDFISKLEVEMEEQSEVHEKADMARKLNLLDLEEKCNLFSYIYDVVILLYL